MEHQPAAKAAAPAPERCRVGLALPWQGPQGRRSTLPCLAPEPPGRPPEQLGKGAVTTGLGLELGQNQN